MTFGRYADACALQRNAVGAVPKRKTIPRTSEHTLPSGTLASCEDTPTSSVQGGWHPTHNGDKPARATREHSTADEGHAAHYANFPAHSDTVQKSKNRYTTSGEDLLTVGIKATCGEGLHNEGAQAASGEDPLTVGVQAACGEDLLPVGVHTTSGDDLLTAGAEATRKTSLP